MKNLIFVFLLFTPVFLSAEIAQDLSPDPIFKEENLDSRISSENIQFQWKTGLIFNFFGFNNADFLSYSHDRYEKNTFNPAKDSDDAFYFVFSNFYLETAFSFQEFFLKINLYRSGFWGNDELEGQDQGKNGIWFKELYFSVAPDSGILLSLGRQRFFLGNSLKDYFFYDTIDGFKGFFAFSENCSFTFLLDITGISSKPDAYLYSSIQKEDGDTENFQGDTVSLRVGGIFSWTRELKSFHFALRYAAGKSGGADRAESGINDLNEADGDFITVNGIRISEISFLPGKMDFTLAYSYGKDFLYRGAKIYQGLGSALNWKFSWNSGLSYFFSGGYFSPQYAGMKSLSMGGSLLYSYLGYFPSVYAGAFHFQDQETNPPSRPDRTCSKTFLKSILDFKSNPFSIFISSLLLWETRKNIDFKWMGSEWEAGLSWFWKQLQIQISGAVYIPSSYYQELSEISSDFTGSRHWFYGFNFSVSCFFEKS